MINVVLTLVLALSFVTLIAVLLLWRHIDKRAGEQRDLQRDFEVRLARVEAEQKSTMSPAEVRAVYSKLAELAGRMDTITTLMHDIQNHLLERDKP
ncbi:MAG TPA: hypothetical protein VGC79_10220 [Polyangiaceae bacterium]